MSHGFNTDKSNANIEDMIKIQKVSITMDNEIPPYQGAEMGGAFNLSSVIPAGYKPVGIVGWYCNRATALRSIIISASEGSYQPAPFQYYISYVLTNIVAQSGNKQFDIWVLLLKVVD